MLQSSSTFKEQKTGIKSRIPGRVSISSYKKPVAEDNWEIKTDRDRSTRKNAGIGITTNRRWVFVEGKTLEEPERNKPVEYQKVMLLFYLCLFVFVFSVVSSR